MSKSSGQKPKRAEKVSSNNNGKSIWKLAVNSVKSSRMRNIFIVLTIILSVSLLMVMALFYAELDTENFRQVSKMQHVVYYGLDKEQIKELAQDERTEYVLGMKRGKSVEVDGRLLQPICYDSSPSKLEDVQISTIEPVKGTVPEKIDEVTISDAFCKFLGIQGEPGEKVSFTFLDGTTEEFVISGIFHQDGESKYFSIVLSEEYGEKGAQLRDISYDGIVRIHGANKMSQTAFLEEIRTIASDYGIERKNVNENNYFLDTLSGGKRQVQQNLMIIGVGIGILFVSVLVIYSVFYLAVVGRIQQFGQLRTIGMTKRQIRRMVRYEGLALCSIGIPAGLLVGGLIGYLLKPGGWSWVNTLLIGLAVTAADIITVLISVRKPAVIASSVSPVEASRYSGVDVKESNKLYRKITPLHLALMNRSRNRKKAALTMISLGVGGVLFMLAAFFCTSTSLEEYARQGPFQDGEFVIDLSYNMAETAEHGITDLQINNAINEEFLEKVESIDGVEKTSVYREALIKWEAHGDNSDDSMVAFGPEEEAKLKTMLESGQADYDAMMKEDTLLITHNDLNEEIYGWKYQIGDRIRLSWYDGQKECEEEFTVAGILDTDKYIKYSNQYGDFVLPEEKLAQMTKGMNLNSQVVVKTDREKEKQIEKGLNQILEEYPSLTMSTLKENEAMTENQFTILFSVMLGLSIFIVAFSLLNMLNTLITNILTRKREFAMLQSVGMTTKQLSHMIQIEGLMLTAGNLVITLVFGTTAGYVMVRILQYFGVEYMHFHFPGILFLAYAVVTAIVPVVVSTVMIKGFQKEALVERLR